MRTSAHHDQALYAKAKRSRLRLGHLREHPAAVAWTFSITVLLTAILLLLLDHIPVREVLPISARILGDVAVARTEGRPRCIDAGSEAPPGRLRYPRGAAQGKPRSDVETWYLVSTHKETAAIGLLSIGRCPDLATCAAWASRRLDLNVDPPGTLRDDGLIPDPEPDEAAVALAEGARLVVLPASLIHPGNKVVAGPFDAAGRTVEDREDLLVTFTGLLDEPVWLERLRSLREGLLPSGTGRPPFQHIRGMAGPGWIYLPLGTRWGHRTCDVGPSETIPLLWRLGELVQPPVRQNSVLVSLLGVRGVEACLRDRLGREANAAGFFVAEEAADLENDVAPPLTLRAFDGTVLAIWEIEISDSDLRTTIGRLKTYGAPAFTRLRDIDTIFQAAVVHWRDGAAADETSRGDREKLFDALAGLGFNVVLGVGGRDAGAIRSFDDALLISDLGELAGPGDLLTGLGPPRDLGWVVQCTTLERRPFQCYLAPVLRYLGEPALFREPRFMEGAACWWRGDEILPFFK